MERNNIISLIKRNVKEVSPDANIILYGSEARGESGPDSDIDVLILLNSENVSVKDRSKINDTIYDLELESGVLISPIVYTKKQWANRPFKTPFYINIMNKGIHL